MKKRLLNALVMSLLLCIFTATKLSAQVVGTYVGSELYDSNNNAVNDLKSSNFNTVIVWTIQLDNNGNIYLNNVPSAPIVENRVFKANTLKNNLASLKQNSGITRIELGIGAAGSPAFNVIKDKYNTQQSEFSPGGLLYDNFKVLRDNLTMVDAINNDDEVTYDVPSAAEFTEMLARIGFKNTIVPYRNASTYWGPLVAQVNAAYPNNIELNYIQGYDGGASNTPCQSQWNFGIPNVIGLSDIRDSQQTFQSKISNWKAECGSILQGGFLWSFYQAKNRGIDPSTYGTAIRNAFGASSNGGGGGNVSNNAPNISRGKPFDVSGTWSAGFEGWRANDGNGTTRWASASTGQTQWIYYDLEAEYLIESIKVDWENAYSYDFNIQLWNGSQWVDVAGLTNNSQLTNRLAVNDVSRYIRLYSYRAPYNHISAWQFEAFGTPVGGGSNNGGSNNGGSNNGGSSSGTNIALGKPFAASSVFSGGYEGWRSNDGNRNTRWASAASGTNTQQWVYYDLEANYNISSVRLYFEAAYSRDFNIQTWNGSQWDNVTGMTNNTNLSPGLGINRTARYIRFISLRHNFSLVSLYEFEVFGTSAGTGKSASQTGEKDAPPPVDLQISTTSELEIKGLKIFPNPAKENFSISLKEFKNAKVTITDMMGRTVYKANTDKSELEITKVGIFKSGIYIINVLDENNESHMRKLIIE